MVFHRLGTVCLHSLQYVPATTRLLIVDFIEMVLKLQLHKFDWIFGVFGCLIEVWGGGVAWKKNLNFEILNVHLVKFKLTRCEINKLVQLE